MRPETSRRAQAAGFTIIEREFISIEYQVNDSIAAQLASLGEYLVLTSRHAVNGIIRNMESQPFTLDGRKIFCLENETLRAASLLGDNRVIATAPNARALAERIKEEGVKEISFIAGNRRRDELPGILAAAGVKVDEVQVYETKLAGTRVTDSYECVLFFSPSAAESFFGSNQLPAGIPCCCIGSSTAAAVAAITDNPVLISGDVSEAGMLLALEKYFHQQLK